MRTFVTRKLHSAKPLIRCHFLPRNTFILDERTILAAVIIGGTFIAISIKYIDFPLAQEIEQHLPVIYRDIFWQICRLGEAVVWTVLPLLMIVAPQISCLVVKHHSQLRTRWLAYKIRLCGIYTAIVLLTSGAIVNIMKYSLGRPRPAKFLATGAIDLEPFTAFIQSDSFPSGHSQTIWGAMICFAVVFPRQTLLFFSIAVFVSGGRVIVLKHFPSDVVAGAILSLLVAYYVRRLLWKFSTNHAGTAIEELRGQ